MQTNGLATLDAVLNALAAVFLVAGFFFIRNKNVTMHRRCMITAFGISIVFLITYVIHHAQVGSVPFGGRGVLRQIYFAILVPHVLLAASVVPLAILTIFRGWTGRIVKHRKIARWTLPIWLYVSLSGVAVYLMLYHL